MWYEYLHIVSRILLLNWIWREKHSTLYVKAQFRPNMSNSIRSTYVSPQLEANSIIPVRQYAVSVRVEPPPFENCGAAMIAEF